MPEAATRHPEPRLEVLWQRHVIANFGSPIARTEAAVRDLASAAERELLELGVGVLEGDDRGDLVVTISRRPL